MTIIDVGLILLGSMAGTLIVNGIRWCVWILREQRHARRMIETIDAMAKHNDLLVEAAMVSDIPRPGYYKPPF